MSHRPIPGCPQVGRGRRPGNGDLFLAIHRVWQSRRDGLWRRCAGSIRGSGRAARRARVRGREGAARRRLRARFPARSSVGCPATCRVLPTSTLATRNPLPSGRGTAVRASARRPWLRFLGRLAGGFDRVGAEAALREGRADLVAFGRPFLANPDLRSASADPELAAPSGDWRRGSANRADRLVTRSRRVTAGACGCLCNADPGFSAGSSSRPPRERSMQPSAPITHETTGGIDVRRRRSRSHRRGAAGRSSQPGESPVPPAAGARRRLGGAQHQGLDRAHALPRHRPWVGPPRDRRPGSGLAIADGHRLRRRRGSRAAHPLLRGEEPSASAGDRGGRRGSLVHVRRRDEPALARPRSHGQGPIPLPGPRSIHQSVDLVPGRQGRMDGGNRIPARPAAQAKNR